MALDRRNRQQPRLRRTAGKHRLTLNTILVGGLAAATLLILAAANMSAAYGNAHRVPDKAAAARIISVSDAAKLHLVGANGDALEEEGKASGTLPGSTRVTLNISSSTATFTFTLHLNGGSITGSGTAKVHQGRSGEDASFGGSTTIKHGNGRYAHVSGTGGFYGAIDRNNDNAEVQIIGKLHD
jgi:hypothetical protein